MDRLSLRGMGKALLPGSVQGRKKGAVPQALKALPAAAHNGLHSSSSSELEVKIQPQRHHEN
ncbi:hypothetical protein EZI45_07855 [Delftia tsuruhatensis]|uniref:hypothetical protein n=1 Tax=Delftia tsuruhatensis TaxID=180282 RepID=UPI001055C8DD|nr:hypothetical protein [Delftia tsuruhatensis]KAA9154612.1 hypothetical protein F3K36_31745 [Delftia sp. BR1]TDF31147.1 hypothetical protein EZI45_07855 [Delftia tsuruhatensis]